MGTRFFSKRVRDIAKKKARQRRHNSRPKTFKSEEAARAWAETNKVKNYELANLRIDPKAKPKIKVVVK